MQNIAILASHNGSGFEAIYEASQKGLLNCKVALLISNNTNAAALQKAAVFGIDHFVINAVTHSDPDAKIEALLRDYECSLVFLSGYMKKLSPRLTQNFRIINSHPALLPKFGGAGMYGHHVHEAVVAAGEERSGVSIHEVNENYDEGKIILQKSISLSKDETPLSLETKIKALEKEAIVEALRACLS